MVLYLQIVQRAQEMLLQECYKSVDILNIIAFHSRTDDIATAPQRIRCLPLIFLGLPPQAGELLNSNATYSYMYEIAVFDLCDDLFKG